MFRRNARANQGQIVLTPNQFNLLTEANQLIANNKFQQAALIFAQLAVEMETTRHPRRAANFHARAAHAFADAGDALQSLSHARAALNLFIQFQMVNRIYHFYTNIIQKMRNHGMQAAVNELEKEFSNKIGAIPSPAQPTPLRSGHLPPSCPKCGAPARSDEVDWIDNQSAECNYCGAVLQVLS